MVAWEKDVAHDLFAILKRWRISKTIPQSSGQLLKIMKTPVAESSSGSLSYRPKNLNEALECASQSRISGNISAYEESEASTKPRNICSIRNLVKDSIIDSLDALQINERSVASNTRNICSNVSFAEDSIIDSLDALRLNEESDENEHPSLEEVNKGSPLQDSSLTAEFQSDFTQLLMACNQTEPLTLSEMFSQFWYHSLSLIKFKNLIFNISSFLA